MKRKTKSILRQCWNIASALVVAAIIINYFIGPAMKTLGLI